MNMPGPVFPQGQAFQQPAPFPQAASPPAASPPAASRQAVNAWQPRPAARATAPRAAVPPQTPSNTSLAMEDAPRPKIRLQAPDPPKSPLVMPRPEELGLNPSAGALASHGTPAAAPTAEVDWNELRSRLHRMGAVGFHLDQVQGQWRATFLVPTGPESSQLVEANAASDAAAVTRALERAEALVRH